jgi:hypothetical protein
MATELPVLPYSFEAGADLRTHQFKFVKLSADDTVILCAAATDKPIGVLQNKPNTGESAEVMLVGITKVQVDEALVAGDLIGTSADGQADKKVVGTDVTHFIAGQVITGAATAGELASALINCANLARAV